MATNDAQESSVCSSNSDYDRYEVFNFDSDTEPDYVKKLNAGLPRTYGVTVNTTTASDDGSETEACCSTRSKKKRLIKKKKKNLQWSARMFENVELDEVERPPREPYRPEQYFEQYLTENIYEQFTEYTNIYYDQNNGKSLNVSINEIKNYFGLQIFMSTFGLRRTRIYWNQTLGCDFVKRTMTRDRFSKIKNSLHIVDNIAHKDETDNIYKIRPLITQVKQVCNDLDKDQKMAIDEQMIPFRGRNMPARQYMPKKPHKYGLKNFVLAGKNGLVFDFLMYQGLQTKLDEAVVSEFGVVAAIVFKLTSTIPNGAKTVLYMDRYFTTIKLVERLQKRNIFVTGTIAESRIKDIDFGITKKDFKKEVRGSYRELVSKNSKLSLLMWQDRNPVTIISSFAGSQPIGQAMRYSKKEGQKISVDLPFAIYDYNQNMCGVDLVDQMLAYYTPPKTKKWTIRAICHLVDLSISNSWIQYKEDCESVDKRPLDLYNFRMHLAEYLCKKVEAKGRGRPRNKTSGGTVRPSNVKRLDGIEHFPKYDSSRNFSSRCALKSCKGKSVFLCVKCNVHLCIKNGQDCFVLYHTKESEALVEPNFSENNSTDSE